MLDRRDFLKLSGTLGLTALLGGSLAGCAETEENENSNGIINKAYATDWGQWTPTGNKTTFETNQHVFYEISPLNYGLLEQAGGDRVYNGEIKIPDGYAYISSESMNIDETTRGIKYNYINIVPVEVLEYQNTETGEVAYPFAGTPLDLEKAQSASKVYRKTM